MSSLGNRIRTVREKRGISQVRLAEALGITNVQLSRYETGDRKPDPEMLSKIAGCLGVSTDYLIGRTDDPTPPGEDSEIDHEWNEIYEKVKKKGAELEATALLRSASKLNKNQMKDILRILEMIEKEEDE